MKKLFVSVLFVMTFIGCSSDDDSKVAEEPKTSVAEDAAAKAKAEAAAKAKAEAEAEAVAKAEAEAEAVKEETKQLSGTWKLIDNDECKAQSTMHISTQDSEIIFSSYEVKRDNKCTHTTKARDFDIEGRSILIDIPNYGKVYWSFHIKDNVLIITETDKSSGYTNTETTKYKKLII